MINTERNRALLTNSVNAMPEMKGSIERMPVRMIGRSYRRVR